MNISPTSSSTSLPNGAAKVAVLGAAGGIGQPLSLLLKLLPGISELRLYDVAPMVNGVAVDLSHIATAAKVTGHIGPSSLPDALYGADLVLIPAGVPRKPGMTRDDLFNINAGIVKTLAQGVAKYCPQAWLAIISNPVNSTVPIAAEVLKQAGCFNPNKLFGVTTLDVVRAETFIAEMLGVNPCRVKVPVIGGHAGKTILPVLSAATPKLVGMTEDKARALMQRIQDAGTEVVKAKAGGGSATLSMAQAAARFAASALKAMSGEEGVVECAYVASAMTDVPFFASEIKLGMEGVAGFLPLPRLNGLERQNFEEMKQELSESIAKGVEFARRYSS
jgi:malate dehydrogenase